AAPIARYFTPRNASGIRAIIITALKITADRTADCGVCNRMMLSAFSTGKVPANIAGIMAKYFATSFAIENVVKDPRVINYCLPSDCGGGKRVVAGDHDGLDAHCAELIEAFLHAALDHIFQFDYAQRAASLLSNDQRSASGASNLFHRGLYPHRHFAVILQ